MSTAVPGILQAIQKTRKIRKECEYTPEERAVLGKYKEEYKSKTTTEEREMLLRTRILVDIFNHWHTQNVDLSPEEGHTRIKV